MKHFRSLNLTIRVLLTLLVLVFALPIRAQSIVTVTGKVTEVSGEPIVGATILVKNTTKGTATDLDGGFMLPDVASTSELVVSYIGMTTQTVKLTEAKMPLDIIMKASASDLDELIVIGYGTAKRKDFTGSVSSVKLEDSPLSLTSNTNTLESLKGSVTGLDVGYTNSAGGSPGIQIRGQNSLNGSNSPLIVVDGVIFMGSINDISPNDIASVDVLKDATSAAVYGSRSANGVICITTKKGKAGKPTVSFSLRNGVDMWACKPHLMSAEEWLDATMARNNYSDASFMTGQQLDNYQNGRSTDWFDLVTRTGYNQDYQAAVSGATDRVNYYMSANYTDVKGIVKGDDYNRFTIKGRIEATINDWIKIGGDASYTRSDYSGVGASLWGCQVMSPYAQPYRVNGQLEKYPNGTNESVNPLWGVEDNGVDNKDMYNIYRINAFAQLTCPYVPGLSYRLNYSTNSVQGVASNFYHENYYTYVGPFDDEARYSTDTQKKYLSSANGSKANSTTTSWVIDNILNYVHSFGNHNIDLTAVATRDSKHYYWERMNGSNFAANGNTSLGITGLPYATTQKIANDANRVHNIGYLVRGSYNYDNTYFITGSYRRDGASVFGANTKWGNFGAVGLAWRISNERFMQKAQWIDDLKIKASWGRNGNQGIGAYSTLSKVAAGSNGGIKVTFNNSGEANYGINQSSIGNADLGWETTEAWNFGFESVLLRNRLFADVDIYFSRTFDQLFSRSIPVMGGFSKIQASMGEVRNRGVEITLRSVNIENKDFSWQSGLTFWLNRDKLTHLYGEDLDNDGKEDDDMGSSLFIGESIHSIFGYRQDGIVQATDQDYIQSNGVQPGTPKYVDYDGDGVITVADRHIIGNTAPSFKMNLSNTFTYKNFQLYAMFTGAFGGGGYYMQANKAAYIIGGSGSFFGVNSMYVPYWTEENKSNEYPAATYTGDDKFKGLQSRTYVRLSDVTLSYSFNMPWMRKAGMNKLDLFVSGKNLVTFTGWKGGDPEIGNSIVDGAYPVMKTVSFGINVSF